MTALKPELDSLEGIDNYKFGWSDNDDYATHVERGLSEQVVRNISALKSEPQWDARSAPQGPEALR